VLIRPGDRHELPALKAAGFTGYLVKPVRAASLAARIGATNSFEHALADTVDEINQAGRAETKPEGLSILVAEDNEINALLARVLLTRLGHRPSMAADGAAAVHAWQAARDAGKPFDLVLMDVQMPEVDGLEATRRIRALENGIESPARIVALTANAYAEDREACLAAGMDGLLVKPLDRERLRDVLDAALRKKTPLAA
jgi:CheY-like chemotaxis protein